MDAYPADLTGAPLAFHNIHAIMQQPNFRVSAQLIIEQEEHHIVNCDARKLPIYYREAITHRYHHKMLCEALSERLAADLRSGQPVSDDPASVRFFKNVQPRHSLRDLFEQLQGIGVNIKGFARKVDCRPCDRRRHLEPQRCSEQTPWRI